MNGIYLLLGSNIGDSKLMFERSIDQINLTIGQIIKSSSIYKTKAWGFEDQPDFLNQVIEVESSLSAEMILKKINEIEEDLGRIRKIKWHARVIDIDILYFGNEIINTKKLIIPHPENHNRKFVLVPMSEIAPEMLHPVFMLTQKELLEKCDDVLDIKKN